MVKKSNERRPMQVGAEFDKKVKQLQGKIKSMEGNDPCLADLTNDLVRVPAFIDVEKAILEKDREAVHSIKIKFDREIR